MIKKNNMTYRGIDYDTKIGQRIGNTKFKVGEEITYTPQGTYDPTGAKLLDIQGTKAFIWSYEKKRIYRIPMKYIYSDKMM